MPDDLSTPPTPVSVLLVVDDDSYGRLGNIVQHLCVGMIDDPVQMRVLMRTAKPCGLDAIGPVPVISVRQRRWTFDRYWPDEILEDLEGDPPDIVHGMSARLCRWAQRMSLTWQCRLIAQVTDLEDVREFRHLLGEARPLCVTATTHLQEVVTRKWPALEPWVRLIPFGVPAEEEPACLDDPQRTPAAIVTTPLTTDCGLDIVLRAVQILIGSGHELQLFVLSSGKAEHGFRRQVEQLDLRRYVTFTGFGSEWDTANAAMLGADFFIEPNPHRRFSAQMLTAMADGLAILAPHGTLQDYLIDGTTACLFDPRHPADLADKWSQLLRDRSEARLLAQSALDYVRAHHQATQMVSATATLYRELCG